MEVASAFSDNQHWSLFSYNNRTSSTESCLPTTPIPYELWSRSDSQISTVLCTLLDRMKTEILEPASSSEERCHECEDVASHRRLNLSPSRFSHACVCGHNVEIRDLVYDPRHRRNTRCPGITIRPKTPPITVNLRI